MRLKRVIKVVLPLGLLLLLGPQEPVIDWSAQWTQVTGTGSEPLRQPAARNAGNAAPPLDSNNIFSQLPDKAAALWVPSGKDRVGPLHAIDALSPNDIWAVGETLDHPPKALVAHWDGVQWRTISTFGVQGRGGPGFWSGRGSSPGTRLYDVVALAPDDVWTVGEYSTWLDMATAMPCCFVPRTLTAHWDGKSFEVVPSAPDKINDGVKMREGWFIGGPDDGSKDAYGSLKAIAAVAKDDIWTVGELSQGQSLIAHWDGIKWSIVDGPEVPNDKSYPLNDIAAISANDIWAVGGSTIIHWDGKRWSEVYKRENSALGWGGFQSISATSSSNIWVGGYSHWSGGCEHSTLYIMRWNGSEWRDTINSDPPLQWDCFSSWNLLSIFALSQDDVWAVGAYRRGPLVMRWNGKTWAVNNCPARGLSYSESLGQLADVVVTAPGEVFAVGEAPGGFFLRLGVGPCPITPTPVPTSTPTPWPTQPQLPTVDPDTIPTPVQTQPGPVETYVPGPIPSIDAPGETVPIPSMVVPAVPLP